MASVEGSRPVRGQAPSPSGAGQPLPKGRPAPGDQAAAFAAHFRESFRTLWLIAVAIVNDAAAAEDIVQEAAVIALGKLDQFQEGTSFTAWMGQIVRFVALNHRRKGIRQQTPSLPGTTMDEMPSGKSGSAILGGTGLGEHGELPEDQTFFDDRVMQALGAVQDVARACLLLRVIEDMDYKQIATIMEIPEGTAMSYVHRARTFLRQRLSELRPSTSGSNHQL